MDKHKMVMVIITSAIMLIVLSNYSTLKQSGETLSRSLSVSYVHPSETFTVKYVVGGASAAPYFFSIKDVVSGGCTVTGGSPIITTLSSPTTETGTVTVTAPITTGTCYFTGDWQLGNSPLANFTNQNVRICNAVNCVQSSWTPTTSTVCPGVSFTQTRTVTTAMDCGGTACGAASQSATGNKACGSTVSGSDSFPNGCSAGTCLSCNTYADGYSTSCVKSINTCNNGVGRTELGCVAQEWITSAGDATTRRYLGDAAQQWINGGGVA